MSSIEILSLIVTIVALVSLSFVFTILFRNYFRGIIESVESGAEDGELLLEEADSRRKSTVWESVLHWTGKILSYLVLGLLVVVFAGSLASRFMGTSMSFAGNIPLVIVSGSMSEKYQGNDYLFTYNLDNQFDTYDIIAVAPYQNEDDVELYDVVAYHASNGQTIVHRVIEIEEFPEGRMFITRGDANRDSDTNAYYGDYLPYDAIVGKYTGFRLPAAGAFVLFLQSGAGVVCVVSIVYCFFIFEFYRRKMDLAIEKRTNGLLALIPFDESKPESELSFDEKLTYDGKVYVLPNGDLPEEKKEEAPKEESK